MLPSEQLENSMEDIPKRKKGRPPKSNVGARQPGERRDRKVEEKDSSYYSPPVIKKTTEALTPDAYKLLRESEAESIPDFQFYSNVKIIKVIEVTESDTLLAAAFIQGQLSKVFVVLEGVDTPDPRSPDPDVQSFAGLVKERLRQLVEGKIVKAVFTGIDRLGRVQAKLTARTINGEISVSEWLVSTRLAIPSSGLKRQEFTAALSHVLREAAKCCPTVLVLNYQC